MKYFFILVIVIGSLCKSVAQAPSFNTEYDTAAIAEFLDSMSVFYDSVEATIQYKHGEVLIADSAATLHISVGFKFISGEQSQYIMHELYGNPDDPSIAGIIMPEELGVTYGEGYMFVMYYRELGYVDDSKNNDLDIKELTEIVHKNDLEENRQRVSDGLETFKMIGWARSPGYDKSKNVLSWAKELKFDSDMETNTLNYNIVILGRKGFIAFNAIATMKDMQQVDSAKNAVIGMTEFNPGYKYDEFDQKTDIVSPWTLNGLVVGSTQLIVDTHSDNKLYIIIGIVAVALVIFGMMKFRKPKTNK